MDNRLASGRRGLDSGSYTDLNRLSQLKVGKDRMVKRTCASRAGIRIAVSQRDAQVDALGHRGPARTIR